MHVNPPVLRSFRDVALAERSLGEHEPLVRLLERYASALAQLTVALTISVASAFVLIAGHAVALPVLIGGGIAALGFGVRTTVCAMDRHDRVLELIIADRSGLPIPAIGRELARLRDPAHRGSLARAYEAVGQLPSPSGRVPHRACVVAVPSVVAQVQPELLRIASLLRGDQPPLCGVAAAEQLLCGGGSSLFGRDVDLLRQDLGRVAYLLVNAPRRPLPRPGAR
jgi:hypothetical protein